MYNELHALKHLKLHWGLVTLKSCVLKVRFSKLWSLWTLVSLNILSKFFGAAGERYVVYRNNNMATLLMWKCHYCCVKFNKIIHIYRQESASLPRCRMKNLYALWNMKSNLQTERKTDTILFCKSYSTFVFEPVLLLCKNLKWS